MYLLLKRLADIILSFVALAILSPILILTAIVLKLTGEHLIIYRQHRIGKDYRKFDIYKFVTMLEDSPKTGTITAKDDPRILPVGKFLRKTKINELPQLFNILFGDMSIVGPRPLVRSEVDMYPQHLRDVIYDSNQPGLTGMGSLFFRDEDELIAATGKEPERAYREDIMPIKGALEAWYRDNKRMWTDIKIVILTAWAVIHPPSAPVIESFRNAPAFPQDELSQYERLTRRPGQESSS